MIINVDLIEAEKHYKEGVKLGSARALNNLGSFFLNNKKNEN